MKTCGTCRHWGNERDTDETFKRCLAVIHDKHDYHSSMQDHYIDDCDGSEWEEKNKREVIAIRQQKAVAVDGSGYFAALKTREDFGCVLHEEQKP